MANPPPRNTAGEQLQALAKELAASFADRLSAIEAIYAKLEADIWPRQVMQDLYAATHALSGTAGTFGYAKISHAARDVLKLVRTVCDTDLQAGDDLRQSLALALQTLRDEIASPVAEEGWLD